MINMISMNVFRLAWVWESECVVLYLQLLHWVWKGEVRAILCHVGLFVNHRLFSLFLQHALSYRKHQALCGRKCSLITCSLQSVLIFFINMFFYERIYKRTKIRFFFYLEIVLAAWRHLFSIWVKYWTQYAQISNWHICW